jgi:hypothetical protein
MPQGEIEDLDKTRDQDRQRARAYPSDPFPVGEGVYAASGDG